MFQALTGRILNPPAFGLDISDLTIKFCRIIPNNASARVEYFGEIEIPGGIVVDGEIRKEEALAKIMENGLRTAEGRSVGERYCIASLPEEKSFVRVLELPKISAEDIPKAVRWEAESVIPLPFEEIYYDYEIVFSPAGASGHRDVLIIAFPRSIIQSYQRVIRQAGFMPLALELESQAISRAVVPEPPALSSLVIIDIGAARTSFIIFAGGSLIFTKSIAVGGRDFESSIAKNLGVSAGEARRLKIEAGLNKRYEGGKIFEALAPALSTLASELNSALWFYRDHPRRRHEELGEISAIYLCGGDANLIGLEKYLAAAVKKPVLRADPFSRLQFPSGAIPPIPRNEALKYTTAIGLALRASGL